MFKTLGGKKEKGNGSENVASHHSSSVPLRVWRHLVVERPHCSGAPLAGGVTSLN